MSKKKVVNVQKSKIENLLKTRSERCTNLRIIDGFLVLVGPLLIEIMNISP